MPLADVTLTAPVEPRQVLQAGANYREHVIQLVAAGSRRTRPAPPRRRAPSRRRSWTTAPRNGEPYFFIGLPACVVGDDVPLVLPAYSEVHDWELELAVVIGREAFRVSPRRRAGPRRRLHDRQRHHDARPRLPQGHEGDRHRLVPVEERPRVPAHRALPRAGAVRRPGRPRDAPRPQRRDHAGLDDRRPAVRHPRAHLGRVADHAAAARATCCSPAAPPATASTGSGSCATAT